MRRARRIPASCSVLVFVLACGLERDWAAWQAVPMTEPGMDTSSTTEGSTGGSTEAASSDSTGTAGSGSGTESGASGTSGGTTTTGPGATTGTVSEGSTGPAAVCGDGVVEGEEECDDPGQTACFGCVWDRLVFVTSKSDHGGDFAGHADMDYYGRRAAWCRAASWHPAGPLGCRVDAGARLRRPRLAAALLRIDSSIDSVGRADDHGARETRQSLHGVVDMKFVYNTGFGGNQALARLGRTESAPRSSGSRSGAAGWRPTGRAHDGGARRGRDSVAAHESMRLRRRRRRPSPLPSSSTGSGAGSGSAGTRLSSIGSPPSGGRPSAARRGSLSW